MKQYLAKYRKTEGVGRIDFYKEHGQIRRSETSIEFGNVKAFVNKVPSMIKGYYQIGLK